MVSTSYSLTVPKRNRPGLRGRGVCLFVGMLLGLVTPLMAKEYSIKQIADKTMLNREPVISESGLIAWYAYERGEDSAQANIFIYYNGVAQKLTKNEADSGLHPFIYRNTVVWEGSLSKEVEYQEMGFIPSSSTNAEVSGSASAQTPAADGSNAVQSTGTPVTSMITKTMLKKGWGICMWTDGSTKPVSFSLDAQPITAATLPAATNQLLDSLENADNKLSEDQNDNVLNVAAPVCWGDYIAWQKATPWPCGWEIVLARSGAAPQQLTTNCYYDMGPQLFDRHLVWYAWDGQDFEIMLHDIQAGQTIPLTDNNYDDVSPVVWNGTVVWEGYPSVEADIFMWKDGAISRISDNVEDDVNPRIWDKFVIWQGMQDDNYEIFLYDGASVRRITDNNYDDVEPDVRDGVMCWVGYVDNWDGEILIQEVEESRPTVLTENEFEDNHPHTANKQVVWEAKREGLPLIYVAEPR